MPTDPEQLDSNRDPSSAAAALSRRRFLRGAGEAAAVGWIAQGVLASATGTRTASVERAPKSKNDGEG